MPKRDVRRYRKYLFKHARGDKEKCNCNCHNGAKGCGVYFLGFIGSAVYYLQQSATFGQGVVAILKAIVWPAFLVYKLLGG